MSYFIVAPHSYCVSAVRDCDTVAADAVAAVHKLLPQADVFQADALRETGDNNRHDERSAAWRREMVRRADIIKPRFVFELHSFPSQYEPFKTRWAGASLVLFESPYNSLWIDALARDISRRAPNVNVMVERKVWHGVAITDHLAPKYNHTLFEFDEARPDLIPEASAAIVAAVKDFNFGVRSLIVNAILFILVLLIIWCAWRFIILKYSNIYNKDGSTVHYGSRRHRINVAPTSHTLW